MRADSNFFEDSIHQWMHNNCFGNASNFCSNDLPWNIIFPFAIWWIWKHRNNVVFNNRPVQLNVHKDIVFSAAEFFYCAITRKNISKKKVQRVRWEKPQQGWVRLNTDGSSVGSTGVAGGGGIIRNDRGEWLAGFSRNIGVASSFIAELWALRDGIQLCLNLNLLCVDIQIDAKAVVELLSNSSYSNNVVLPLVDDCRQMISQLTQVRIGHCYREVNSCADLLAKIGTNQVRDFVLYDAPPVDILPFLQSDSSGLYYIRLCNDVISSS